MINYQTITIDLQPDYREPVMQMYLSERDVGRPIQVNVLMQGQPYSFTAGTTVHIDLRKPSGHVVQVNGNYAVGSNVVLFNVVEQMAAEPGMCLTELSIVGDGQDPIGSKNWLTKVELSPMHAGDPSETWIEDLDELVQDAMEGHIDATLSIPGDAADAAAVGEELADLKSAIEQIEPGLSGDAKAALLNCFAHVVWIDEHGQDYYDALETALYEGSYPRITATFNPGTNVIYTDDSLDTLKQYLVVRYFESESSSGVVVSSSDYTLSGTLTAGVSEITVTYGTLSTAFLVTVATHVLYSLPANTVFDGTDAGVVNTGICPLESDSSFSIICKGTIIDDGDSNRSHSIFFLRDGSLGFALTGEWTKIRQLYINSHSQRVSYNSRMTPTAGTYTFRLAFSHAAGASIYNAQVYLDGHNNNQYDNSYSYVAGSYPVYIGASYNYQHGEMIPFYNKFIGTMEEFKILDYALTKSECDAYCAV